jgi:hypothetical protein
MRVTKRYLRYKVTLYRLRQSDPYLADVYRGARTALSEVDALLRAEPDDLAAVYAEVCDRHGF